MLMSAYPLGPGFAGPRGARREEVAAPAGASVDYYVRSEHGRETNPNPAVLARALLLDEEEGTHLHVLARQSANEGPGRKRAPRLMAAGLGRQAAFNLRCPRRS
jgi:hypothetical protein